MNSNMTNGIRASNIEGHFEKSTEVVKGIKKGISLYRINNSISCSISRPLLSSFFKYPPIHEVPICFSNN